MGLDINSVRFLIEARKRGTEFGEVVTFGRQDLNVFPAKMVEVLQAHGFPADAFKGEDKHLYAESCFKSLGATQVHSMDVSAFEGATFIQDLNEPIGLELRERFDLVYDGGTLEHVFHFPTALKNCMEMVKVGGRFFTHTVTNNWCGHGFYQFSPELFYRALSRENGFEVERMVAHRAGPYGPWYEVMDPEQIGAEARVELCSIVPIMLLIQARRVAAVPIFAQAPQQSDYTPRWQQKPVEPGGVPAVNPYAAPRPWLSRSFPGLARLLNVCKIGFGILRTLLFWDPRCFRRVPKP
ncbi:MAG TPA: class I SAM-dependent methyltransferase [Verrucomicrobiae bacterium]|nr:class I SAM-dependent methyltransferase [Verrucomicrobiae bacterium]